MLAVVLMTAAATGAPRPPALEVQDVGDEQITGWLEGLLREDPRIEASRIIVTTRHGFVELSGTVHSLPARSFIELAAQRISGVRGVINNIEVAPPRRDDSEIAGDVLRRLSANSVLRVTGIVVRSRDGAVSLLGEVTDRSRRDEAGAVASEVRGVRSVSNALRIAGRAPRSDVELIRLVAAVLDRDAYLAGFPINVSVRDGRVVLSGTVANAFAKTRAERRADNVVGVRGVENRLHIEPGSKRVMRQRQVRPADGDVRRTVIAELDSDGRVDSSSLSVDVSHGAVVLDGTVASYYQKVIAERDARQVNGVRHVVNSLEVDPSRTDDRRIAEEVRSSLESDGALTGSRIDVGVSSGVVTLSGAVAGRYAKLHAEEVASRPLGVRRVVNLLGWSPSDRPSNAELEREIGERLASDWLTAPMRVRIGVSVLDGIATLTGRVELWAERCEAARVAIATRGVWLVDNELRVVGQPFPLDRWYSEADFLFDPWY